MKIGNKGIDWSDPKSKVSKYFRLETVTSGDPRRMPKGIVVRRNIKKFAAELDKLVDRHGRIKVNSWYRPEPINSAVGGAKNSQHVNGWAADISLEGKNARTQREFEQWLDANWQGGVGRGLAAGKGFTHVDLGPKRRWNY
jgi:uncharacterized protein YcbK (DUF882 family)